MAKFSVWNVPLMIAQGLLLCFVILGVFYSTDPVKTIVRDQIFNDKEEIEVFIAYFAVVIGILLVIIFSFGRKSDSLMSLFSKKADELMKNIDNSKMGIDDRLFFKGTLGIYDDIESEILRMQEDGEHIIIDILGFTLFSLQNKFVVWKGEKTLHNMTFNLFYIDQDYIKNSKDIDISWANRVNDYTERIRRFILDQEEYLKERNVEINLYPISHIPAVHGFRLHNSAIYISIATWDDQLLLENPADRSTYLKIQNGDTSMFSIYIRRLFLSWTKKAKGQIKGINKLKSH